MTRETKIGVALMVLLVGVFGAIFYKKWNDRRPTASVAEAAESADDATSPAVPSPAEPAPAQPSVAERAIPIENPFAAAAPSAQSEPAEVGGTGAGSDDPFARSDSDPFADTASTKHSSAAASAVPEDSPFAGDAPLMSVSNGGVKPGTAPTEQVPGRPSAAPGAVDDPFSDAAADDSATAAAPVASTEPPSADDPFGETDAPASRAAGTPVASARPPLEEDPFGEPANEGALPSDEASSFGSEPAGAQAPASEPTDAPESLFPAEAAGSAGGPFSEPATATTGAASAPPEGALEPRPDPAAVEAFDEFADGPNPAQAASAEPEEFGSPAAGPPPGGAPSPQELSAEPMADATAAPEARSGSYTVQENDSYWSISKRVYGTPAYFQALERVNRARIGAAGKLKPGMTVLTPSEEVLRAQFPHLAASAGPTGGSRANDSGKPGFLFDEKGEPAYRVGKDDTLSGIAQAHLGRASRWIQIYEKNRDVVPDPKALKPGTVLRLPRDASRVRLVPQG